MMDDKDGTIRNRAYAIWQEEGQPAGRDADHWHQAETELTPTASGDCEESIAAVDASGQPDVDGGAAAPAWEEPAEPGAAADATAATSPLAKLKKKTAKIAKSL